MPISLLPLLHKFSMDDVTNYMTRSHFACFLFFLFLGRKAKYQELGRAVKTVFLLHLKYLDTHKVSLSSITYINQLLTMFG